MTRARDRRRYPTLTDEQFRELFRPENLPPQPWRYTLTPRLVLNLTRVADAAGQMRASPLSYYRQKELAARAKRKRILLEHLVEPCPPSSRGRGPTGAGRDDLIVRDTLADTHRREELPVRPKAHEQPESQRGQPETEKAPFCEPVAPGHLWQRAERCQTGDQGRAGGEARHQSG